MDRSRLVCILFPLFQSRLTRRFRIIAQLRPAPSQVPRDADSPHAPADGPVPPVSLGPPGMYASFDWEDLDALFPWLELKQSDNGNDEGAGTHRAGLGFAR